ncbi:GEVED domain-containing protein [Rhodopirellula islandica]|nr:GEVED domain-containing protein [Rhodopirellula islandica]
MSTRTFRDRFLRRKPARPNPGRRRSFRLEQLEKRNLLATYIVDSLTDDGSGGTTLREAVEAASFNEARHGLPAGESSDVIRFADSLFFDGPATLTMRPELYTTKPYPRASYFVPGAMHVFADTAADTQAVFPAFVEGTITIIGPGADLLSIDANGSQSIFVIDDQVKLSGMQLTGSSGRAITNATYTNAATSAVETATIDLEINDMIVRGNPGGAAALSRGVITIRNSVIENNGFADEMTRVESGGALFVTSLGYQEVSSLIVEDSVIRGNQALNGGGIGVDEGSVVVSRSTIEMNSAIGNSDQQSSGGGIYLDPVSKQADVSIYESEIRSNTASQGGGIYLSDGSTRGSSKESVVRVRDSNIIGNQATVSGGGVSVFAGSNASESPKLVLSNSSVTLNSAPIGGGVDNVGGVLEITGSSFTDNEASENGGAIASRQSDTPLASDHPTATISNSTISGNRSSGVGGGIFYDPRPESADDAKLTLINTTITLNQAGTGGGLAINEADGLPTSKLVNTIVAGNTLAGDSTASDIHLVSSAPILVAQSRFNLIGDPATAGGLVDDRNEATGNGNIVGDLLGQPLNLDAILFRNLADNLGGPALPPLFGTGRQIQRPAMHSLKLDSPAMDAGTPFLPSAVDGIRFDDNGDPIVPVDAPYSDALHADGRGYPFLRRDSFLGGGGIVAGAVDIGAYENQIRPIFTGSELVVSTLDDENDGDYSYGELSLREAVAIANLSPDDNGIRFAPSLIETDAGEISTIYLTSPIEILFNVTVSGPGSDLLQISGGHGTRMLEIGPLATTSISGLAFVDGLGESPRFDQTQFDGASITAQGGAIFNAGKTTIEDALFARNTSLATEKVGFEAAAADGGGAISNAGVMTIKDTVFRDNSSESNGGAITNHALPFGAFDLQIGLTNSPTLAIGPNVQFENNHADTDGGAIQTWQPISIVDSTFTGNSAGRDGGAIAFGIEYRGVGLYVYDSPGQDLVQRSEFRNNQAANYGGAITVNDKASVRVVDSIVDQNNSSYGGGIEAVGYLELERTTVSRNVATVSGGGLAFFGQGIFTINSSTISGNRVQGVVPGYGGGISIQKNARESATIYQPTSQSQQINDSTISGNQVISALGLNALGSGLWTNDQITLTNSIVSGNFQDNGIGPQVFIRETGSIHAPLPNIIPNYNSTISGVNDLSRFSGATTITVDPNLQSLADNGGRAETNAIGPTSVAIDNGQRQGLLDQRGYPVTDQLDPFFDLRDDDGEVGDIGAYESSQVHIVDFTSETRNASQYGTAEAVSFGLGIDDGKPNSTIPKDPGFLGIEFNKTFNVGPGIYEDPLFGSEWGANANANVQGKLGLEYGYFINSGSVDTFYDGQFAYRVDQLPNTDDFVINTSSTLTDGKLFTTSPRVSAYADLVLQFNASIAGTACVISCVSGSVPIGIDTKVPLFSINRQEEDDNGNKLFLGANGLTTDSAGGTNPPAFDGDIVVAGLDLQSALDIDLSDGDDSQTDKLGSIRTERRQAEIDKAAGKPGDHDAIIRNAVAAEKSATQKKKGSVEVSSPAFTLSFGQAEDLLGVEVGLSVGASAKAGPVSAEITKNLGKIALTVPEIDLSDTTFDTPQGKLSATTDDFAIGSNVDAKRQIAALSVDVGALGPFGVYNLSAGPIDIEATTVSYVISPRLAISQDVSVEPFFDESHQAGFDFVFTGGGTINVSIGDASPVALSSGGSISFMPGSEVRIDANGNSDIQVNPSITVGNRFSNDIGLEFDVLGVLEVLRLKLNAFGEQLFDIGPLYETSHSLLDAIGVDALDFGSIFASTFNLPASTTQIESFSLNSAEEGAARDGKSPGAAFLLQSGVPTQIDPVNGQTTYLSVPLLGPDNVLHNDVLFETQSQDTVLIRPPYGGLTLELLDSSGQVRSSFELDVKGTTFTSGNGPETWRLKGFENLLGSQALFGVQFSGDATREVTVTVEGGSALSLPGVHTDRLLTAEKQEALNRASTLFVRNSDLALDIDGDGRLSPTTDGTLIARFMDGQRGATLIAGITSDDVVSDAATRTDAAEIEMVLQNLLMQGRLDVDDNDTVDPKIDGVLILRYMSAIGGSSTTQQALTDGLDLNALGGRRTLPADIRAFMEGGESPPLNQTFADDVLSLSDRSGIPRFRVSSSAVTGSSPFAPVLTPFVSGTGIFTLDTLGSTVTFDETYLVDANDPSTRTLVRSRAEGTPARTIDLPEEFQKYLGDPLSPEIDTLLGRFETPTPARTQILGLEEPIFVRVPDASGYEFTLPAGLTAKEIHFDPNVGGNLFLQHTEANSGTNIDFDLFIASTGEWREVSMSTPFTLPAGVSTFELYPRPIVTSRLLDPNDDGDVNLDLTVGLVLEGNQTSSPALTVNVLADRQELINLYEIQVGVGSDSAAFETRIARDGAYVAISTNEVQSSLSSQRIDLDVDVSNDYPRMLVKFSRGTLEDLPSGLYRVWANWAADPNVGTYFGGIEYTASTSEDGLSTVKKFEVDPRRFPNQDLVVNGLVYQELFDIRVGGNALSIGAIDLNRIRRDIYVQRIDDTVNVDVTQNPSSGIPLALAPSYAQEFPGRSAVSVTATAAGFKPMTDTYSVTLTDQPFGSVPTHGIADQIVPLGTTQHMIDLSSVFDAPDLILSVESNNSLVTVAIDGDNLSIGFTENASAKVFLTAQNASGMLMGTDTFVISTGDSSVRRTTVLDPISDKIVPVTLPAVYRYRFNDESLNEDSGGPSLVAVGGAFSDFGYRFGENEGLNLSSVLSDPGEYRIEFDFAFDEYFGFQKIIDFKGLTSDNGLYTNGHQLAFYPIADSTFNLPYGLTTGGRYRLQITRDAETSQVTVSIANEEVIKFIDDSGIAIFSGPNNTIRLFQDDQSTGSWEAGSGWVDNLQVRDGLIDPFKLASVTDFSTRYSDREFVTYSSLDAGNSGPLPDQLGPDRAVVVTGKPDAEDTLILDARTGPLYQPFRFHAEPGEVAPATGWTDEIVIQGEGVQIDLRESEIQGIGRIDLRGSGPNTLIVTADALFNNDPGLHPLIVIAEADDTVIRAGDTAWIKLPARQLDPTSGLNFDVYQSGAAVLWVSAPSATLPPTAPAEGPDFDFPQSTLSAELTNELEVPGQIVLVPPSDANLMAGERFTIDVLYNIDDASGLIPPAILVEVHYDSTKIAFSDLPFLLANGLVNDIDSESPEFETVDDGNVRTNRTLIFSFTDFLGAWPAEATQSTKLATIEFQGGDATGITDIRLTGLSSNGFIFDAEDFALLSVDTNTPTITLTTDTVTLAAGQTLSDALAIINPQATDLVDELPTITNDAPSVLPTGMTTILFSATDKAGNTSTASATVNVLGRSMDFGDAPSLTQSGFASDYPVTKAQDGASHSVGSLFLGTSVDVETDGVPSPNAEGDTDDDGVDFLVDPVATMDRLSVSSVRVHSSGGGIVDAWLDFNRDGDWNDPGERIISGAAVDSGDTLLSYQVPAGASSGTSYARFRLSSLGSELPTGAAADGEVEDYSVELISGATSPTVVVQPGASDTSLFLDPDLVRLVSGALTVFEAPSDQVGTIDYRPLVTPEAINLMLAAEHTVAANQIQFGVFADGSSVNVSGIGGSIDLTNVATQAAQGRVTLDLTHGDPSSATIDAILARKWSMDSLPMQVMIGVEDRVLFADADEWRMTDPVMTSGVFQLTAANQSGNASIVVSSARPWQNFIRLNDVTNDGVVRASDALRIINELNSQDFSSSDGRLIDPASLSESMVSYYDTSGDGVVSALDALRVINELNAVSAGGEPLENASQGSQLAVPMGPAEQLPLASIPPEEPMLAFDAWKQKPRFAAADLLSTDLVIRQRLSTTTPSDSSVEESVSDENWRAVDELFSQSNPLEQNIL